MTYIKPMISVYDKATLMQIEAQAKSKCCPTGKTNA